MAARGETSLAVRLRAILFAFGPGAANRGHLLLHLLLSGWSTGLHHHHPTFSPIGKEGGAVGFGVVALLHVCSTFKLKVEQRPRSSFRARRTGVSFAWRPAVA